MDIDVIEKYYKQKYKEDISIISTRQKIISNIENIEDKIEYENIEKDGYEIIKTKRNTSVFDNKCKHCKSSVYKEVDRVYYLKYGCCEQCYIYKEENRNGR